MRALLAISCLALVFCSVAGEAISSIIINPGKAPPDNRAEQGTKNKNGDKLVEGDMVADSKDGTVRNAIKNANRKWPKDASGNVIIPYVFDRSLGGQAQQAIKQAIQDYNSYSCIRWVPRTNQAEYISFFTGDGCWSYVGTTHQPAQQISIGQGCEYKGTAAHEMMHCIGFDHEQTRPDRDQYVTIMFQNIEPANRYNFDSCQDCTTQDLPYDYSSVMHYGADYFTANGQQTIVPKQAGAKIGQREGLTALDFKKINKLYQCGNVGGGGNGNGNGNGGNCKDSIDCSVYSRDQCNGAERDSFKFYCPKFCGFC